MLHTPAQRDPRGYVIPSDQPDFPTATKFVNILIKAGVVAHRATAPFTVNGKQYPAGSYVFKAAQPFRAARATHASHPLPAETKLMSEKPPQAVFPIDEGNIAR